MTRSLRPNLKSARRVVGEETLVVTPHDGVLHTLNPTATEVLRLIEAGKDWEALVAELLAMYEVEEATLRADLEALVDELLAKKVLDEA